MRGMDSARNGAQYARYTAGLENAHDAFDEQSATPIIDLERSKPTWNALRRTGDRESYDRRHGTAPTSGSGGANRRPPVCVIRLLICRTIHNRTKVT